MEAKQTHGRCQCEHEKHGRYGCQGIASWTVRTTYGRFEVCDKCAGDECMPLATARASEGAMEAKTYRDGYDRRTRSVRVAEFRPLMAAEARTGERRTFYFEDNNGEVRECRANGAPKTWKTRPDVELPIKYGMYECARVRSLPDGTMERLLVMVSEGWRDEQRPTLAAAARDGATR